MSWKNIPDAFTIDDIGARLLANLARGIYNYEAVLREYVQNACDAYKELPILPDHPTINIRIVSEDTITIQDHGIGMDERRIKDCKKIAVSPKAAFHGEMTGFRGIGIWAGFQACDRLEIETTMAGVPVRYRLRINFAEIYEHVNEDLNIKVLLDDRFSIDADDVSLEDHYTVVRLVGLRDDYRKLANADELQRIISQNLPCKIDPTFEYAECITKVLHQIDGYQEFPILVEGGEVFKHFPSGLQEPRFETLKSDGEEYARCWYCTGDGSLDLRKQELEYRSFRLRIRNFAVGHTGIYDEEDGSAYGIVNKRKLSSRAHLNWHVGEIHITNPEILPDTPRISLELDQKAKRAIEAIRGFYEDRIADSRALSQFNTREKELDAAEKLLNDLDSTPQGNVRGVLEKLSEQESATKGRPPTDKVKRRLRELLSDRDIKNRRQKLIKQLTNKSPSISVSIPLTPPPSPSKNTDLQPSTSSKQTRITDEGAQGLGKIDVEQLLSDIIAVVESKLPAGDDLVADLCEAIQGIFVTHGLIDAEE
jgi:hypothetical protein